MTSTFRRSILPLLAFATSVTAFAGSPDLAATPQTPPPSRGMELIDPAAFGFGRPGYMVDATFMDTQDFSNLPGGVDFFELRTVLPLWTTKLRDTRIGVTLGYTLTELDFNGFAGLGSESLHNLEAQIAAFWRPQQSPWWGLGFITPGLSTDFQGVSGDDFEIAGLGLLGYQVTDSFSLAGGLFAQYAAEDARVFPALGFIWQPKPFILQVTPPFVVLGWNATEHVTLSLSAYPSGGAWDVEDPNVNRVDLSGWQTAASVIVKATDRLSLSLRAGLNVGGELELSDGNRRVIANETLESAPFAALNVRWAF